ncbi:MAG: hypothetical protein RLZZ165_234 [Bacteroidota bacterium]
MITTALHFKVEFGIYSQPKEKGNPQTSPYKAIYSRPKEKENPHMEKGNPPESLPSTIQMRPKDKGKRRALLRDTFQICFLCRSLVHK